MASTDHALFYNSDNGDRVYDATSFEEWLKKFFTTGVFSGDLQVTADGSNMQIHVAPGYCNVNGKVRVFTGTQDFTLATAHGTYPRIDTVVIERNDTDRDVTVKVVTGSPTSSPSPKALVRSNGVYQLAIAQITIAAGATRVYQRDISDTRPNGSLCGIVAAAVATPSFSTYYSQFTDAFNAWFDRMKDQLTTDAAGSLQTQIDSLSGSIGSKVDKVSGKGLSTNDYTDAEKTKLDGLSNYTHPTTAGNKHIPSGGSSNQILRWSASGTATWSNEKSYSLGLTNGNILSFSVSNGVLAITLKNASNSNISSGSVQQKTYSLN